jgi:hypothetical protein
MSHSIKKVGRTLSIGRNSDRVQQVQIDFGRGDTLDESEARKVAEIVLKMLNYPSTIDLIFSQTIQSTEE